MGPRVRLAVTLLVVFVLGALALAAWATDFVTMQGEWTIYTAQCNGSWMEKRCSGELKSAERYRFRTLKAHREVLFWTVGDETGESGRYTQCAIQDGRNWTCPRNDHASRTITHQMTRGIPVRDSDAPHPEFHAVPKWKWEALNRGIPVGRGASN